MPSTRRPFEIVAIQIAMTRMFEPTKGWFDITMMDTCWRLANITPTPQVRDALAVFHCLHWTEVSAEIRYDVAEYAARSLGWEPESVTDFAPFAIQPFSPTVSEA